MTREKAIEIVKEFIKGTCLHMVDQEALETLIPELTENDNERIINLIRSLLENARKAQSNTALYKEYDDALAWLKKQKERDLDIVPELRPTAWGEGYQHGCKDTEEKYSEMRVCSSKEWDDAISDAFKHGMDEGKKQKTVEYIPDSVKFSEGYKTGREVGFREGVESVKSTEWSKEDEKMRINILNALTPQLVYSVGKGTYTGTSTYKYDDEIKWLKNLSSDFKKRNEDVAKLCSNEWSKEDEKRVKQLIYDTEAIRAGYEKRKESLGDDFNDELIKDCDEQINWLKSLPERFSLQPNAELNEEDIKKIRSEEYTKGFNDAAFGGKLKEWSDEDEKELDCIIKILDRLGYEEFCKSSRDQDVEEERFYYKEIQFLKRLKSLHLQPKKEWSEEDEKMRDMLITRLNWITYNTRTDGTSPNITFFDEIDWLKSLRPQPKQEWSEEDKRNLDRALFYVRDYQKNNGVTDGSKECVDWLKSLRPQPKKNDMITPNKEFFQWIYDRLVNVHNEDPNVDYMISFKRRIEELPVDKPHWKPREEHLSALLAVFNDPNNIGSQTCQLALTDLYEQLKKL